MILEQAELLIETKTLFLSQCLWTRRSAPQPRFPGQGIWGPWPPPSLLPVPPEEQTCLSPQAPPPPPPFRPRAPGPPSYARKRPPSATGLPGLPGNRSPLHSARCLAPVPSLPFPRRGRPSAGWRMVTVGRQGAVKVQGSVTASQGSTLQPRGAGD